MRAASSMRMRPKPLGCGVRRPDSNSLSTCARYAWSAGSFGSTKMSKARLTIWITVRVEPLCSIPLNQESPWMLST